MIIHLKEIFARFGIPPEMVSDNGPQFNSEEIYQFSQSFGFKHITTSPWQMGWLKEQYIRTTKHLLQNSPDPYKALLNYRATQMPWCSLSPAELLMGRKIRTELTQLTQTLIPKCTHIRNFRSQDQKYKNSQNIKTPN